LADRFLVLRSALYVEKNQSTQDIQDLCTDMPHRRYEDSTVISIERAIQIILNVLYSKPKKPKHKRNKLTERNQKITELHQKGHTFEEIGGMFGISSQRVHQIVNSKRK